MSPYIVTLQPGKNVHQAVAKLAHFIVERWMPGNAGGVHVMITPQICGMLLPIWERVNEAQKPKQFRVTIQGNRPVFAEIP